METVQNYIIGDCLEFLPRIKTASVDLILTDLPYGTTACKWDSIIDLEALWLQYNRIIKDHGAIVLTATMQFAVDLIVSNRKYFRYDLVWEKSRAVGFLNANKMPLRNHELILVFYKHLPTFNPQYTKGNDGNLMDKKTGSNVGFASDKENELYGSTSLARGHPGRHKRTDGTRNPTSVIKPDEMINTEIYGKTPRLDTDDHKPPVEGQRSPVSIVKHQNGNNATIHPTQKPLSLWEYIIRTYTNPGDVVHDSCLGAGTTLEACVNLNRNCTCFEQLDKWVWNYKKILDSKKNLYQLSKIFKREL